MRNLVRVRVRVRIWVRDRVRVRVRLFSSLRRLRCGEYTESRVRVDFVANFRFRAKQWIKDIIKYCRLARTTNIGLLYPKNTYKNIEGHSHWLSPNQNIGGGVSSASPAWVTPVTAWTNGSRTLSILYSGSVRTISILQADRVCGARHNKSEDMHIQT